MGDIALVLASDGKAQGAPREALGILSLASSLRSSGFSVDVYDFSLVPESQSDFLQGLSAGAYRLVGLSVNAGNWRRSFALAREIKSICPGAHVTAGGYVPTFQPEKTLMMVPYIDSVLRGEGEISLVLLARQVVRHESVEVSGATVRSKQGFCHTELPPSIADLDVLPDPARDHLSKVKMSPDPVALISGSRGCYGRCSFCSIAAFYGNHPGSLAWRGRSPQRIVAEMEQIIRNYGISRFEFVDENFFGPPAQRASRIEAFVSEIRRRQLKVSFTVEGRANDLDRSELKRLKDVGLMHVYVGLESGSPSQLARFCKGISPETNAQAVRLLRELELEPPRYGLIMFDYWVTLDEIKDNCRFIAAHLTRKDPSYFTNPLTLFPGVPARKQELTGYSTEDAPTPARRFNDEAVAILYQMAVELASVASSPQVTRSSEVRSKVGELLLRAFADLDEPLRSGNYATANAVFSSYRRECSSLVGGDLRGSDSRLRF